MIDTVAGRERMLQNSDVFDVYLGEVVRHGKESGFSRASPIRKGPVWMGHPSMAALVCDGEVILNFVGGDCENTIDVESGVVAVGSLTVVRRGRISPE